MYVRILDSMERTPYSRCLCNVAFTIQYRKSAYMEPCQFPRVAMLSKTLRDLG